MKTLDEVIMAFDICKNGTCKDCPSAVMLSPNDYRCSEEHIDDALHYLKEYQTILPLLPSLVNTAIAVQKKGKTIG